MNNIIRGGTGLIGISTMISLMLICCSISTSSMGQPIARSVIGSDSFVNPLLVTGPDPWVVHRNGVYYFCRTTGHNIQLLATRKMSRLGQAKPVTIWTPPKTGKYAKQLWAPEMHYIHHKWYIYFAADDGNNDHHRMYVLENKSKDPLSDNWIFKGQITDPTNKWAIDGSVFAYKKKLYTVWSGWEGDENVHQNIYIARLKNPWTIQGERVLLSTSDHDWEKRGSVKGSLPTVNEGPEILKSPTDQLFLVYSASGCWTDHYALGMLTLKKGAHPMHAGDWTKSGKPVFASAPQNGVYAPGHNGFFKSPDGKEDWIIYHANDKPGQGCGRFRSPRMQRIHWNADGTPDFGLPVKTGEKLAVPSGE